MTTVPGLEVEDVQDCAERLYHWQEEPHRLWSLLDMLRFYAATFITVSTNLTDAVQALLALATLTDDSDIARQMANVLLRLREVEKELHNLPVSFSLRAQAGRLIAQVEGTDHSPDAALVVHALCQELKKCLITELTQHLFFGVAPDRKWLYLEPGKWFGETTLSRFPGIERDVRDACQCLALAQWTASVFHAMRILEHGLRGLAGRLGVVDVELENWKNVIDQIEKAVRALEALPKSPEKSEQVQFYSEAAAQFRYFKDAWRNHVSHSRTHYDEQEARYVLDAVKRFMGTLAR